MSKPDDEQRLSSLKKAINTTYGKCKRVKDSTIPVIKKEKSVSRHRKENWPIIKHGFVNTDPAPWGFNWLLGYCEQSNNFTD